MMPICLPPSPAALSRIAGQPIPRDALREEDLPPHLRMNIRVVDAAGKTLAAGRDLGEVRRQLGQQPRDAMIDDPRWTRDGLTRWDFGDLPERVEIRRGAATLSGFPALLDEGPSVALRLFDSPEWAAHESRCGVRRLFCLAAHAELKRQVDWLPNLERSGRQIAALMKASELRGSSRTSSPTGRSWTMACCPGQSMSSSSDSRRAAADSPRPYSQWPT